MTSKRHVDYGVLPNRIIITPTPTRSRHHPPPHLRTERDDAHLAAAEARRRRRNAKRLGYPMRPTDVVLLTGVIEPGDVILEPQAGWGFARDDEWGKPVTDFVMAVRSDLPQTSGPGLFT